MIKLIIIFALLLSACTNLSGNKEKPLLYEAKINGDYASIAQCVTNKLHTDTRWFMRLLQYQFRLYPEIETAEIYAYDTRFIPGIYASNSPTNPDAVLDYVNPNPTILSDSPKPVYPELTYNFVLNIKKIRDLEVYATLHGNKYVGTITWKYLQTCKTFE